MIQARTVIYFAQKLGNAEAEWEDAGATAPADRVSGRGQRLAVADGATSGFGSARWAQQLVAGFVGADRDGPPELTRGALRKWFEVMQARWREDPRLAGATELQKIKLAQVGSFATFLGCELTDRGWLAVALGDTVLFQVRADRLVAQFPRMAAGDFGSNPDGVSTRPETLSGMAGRVLAAQGDLADGDVLYLATDALAQWMIGADQSALWPMLAGLGHPDTFRALVADRRRSGELHNDDVTLLRAHIVSSRPSDLVVCL